jgi:hypothetical protein
MGKWVWNMAMNHLSILINVGLPLSPSIVLWSISSIVLVPFIIFLAHLGALLSVGVRANVQCTPAGCYWETLIGQRQKYNSEHNLFCFTGELRKKCQAVLLPLC